VSGEEYEWMEGIENAMLCEKEKERINPFGE
jgi:hypothetical protein